MIADQFHANPKTGRVSRCRASYECPFGTEAAHHSTADEARAAFERSQEEFLIPRAARKSRPVKIFRIGALEPQAKAAFEELDSVLGFMDRHVPEGRMSRRGALFASPDLASHGRWVRGTDSGESHELTVDPDSVYIYPVKIYESASMSFANGEIERAEEEAREYWASGMTLTEWNEWSSTTELERGTWEVLFPPSAIIGSKPVSNRRVIENATDTDASEINWKLESRRAARGLIWRKDAVVDS